MGTEKGTLTFREVMKQMLKEHDKTAWEAKEKGQLVCWSTSMAPQELLIDYDGYCDPLSGKSRGCHRCSQGCPYMY